MPQKKSHVVLWVLVMAVLGAVTGIYAKGVQFFSSHGLPNTKINHMDCSYKDFGEIEELLISKESDGQKIIITGRDGLTEEIPLQELVGDPVFTPALNDVLTRESPFLWPTAFFRYKQYNLKAEAPFDHEKAKAAVRSLSCVENGKDPVNAKIDLIDGNRYGIRAEDKGSIVVTDLLLDALETAVDEGTGGVDLELSGCYKEPKILSDDPELLKKMKYISHYQDEVITIDMTGDKITLDYDEFGKWLEYKKGKFKWRKENTLGAYVKELADAYNTIYTERYFTTTSGERITVGGTSVDTYGFWMDEDETENIIREAVMSGKSQTIEPVWKVPALTRGSDNGDIGNTYIEVSVDAQHMWYYKDGELLLDTDVVTGMMTEDRKTPTGGVYRVLGKATDHTMRGSYGTTHVNFWLPATWTGVGIHDAPWRSSYGGEIYVHNGSHGCINTPYDPMKKLYEMVSMDTPVIIY